MVLDKSYSPGAELVLYLLFFYLAGGTKKKVHFCTMLLLGSVCSEEGDVSNIW